jgi:hypothetical protein
LGLYAKREKNIKVILPKIALNLTKLFLIFLLSEIFQNFFAKTVDIHNRLCYTVL